MAGPSALGLGFGVYTILPMPILCGVYCNNGGSGGTIILRNSVSDDGLGWGAELGYVREEQS